MEPGGEAKKRIVVPLNAAIWIGLSAAIILLWLTNLAQLWPWLIAGKSDLTSWEVLTELLVPLGVGTAGAAVAITAARSSRLSVDIASQARQDEIDRTHRAEIEGGRADRRLLATPIGEWMTRLADDQIRSRSWKAVQSEEILLVAKARLQRDGERLVPLIQEYAGLAGNPVIPNFTDDSNREQRSAGIGKLATRRDAGLRLLFDWIDDPDVYDSMLREWLNDSDR